MYKGKKTCKILKDIRKQIAEKNDIAFVTSECRHQGDCAGTCPACEAEVRYLEQELRRRQQLGK
nr:energy transducer TonB [Bacteroidales bacterium]